jgi:4-amino-4-deoxy-L-arabinose transferase-like glycosyltransferase
MRLDSASPSSETSTLKELSETQPSVKARISWRDLIARGTALLAVVLMAASATQFHPSNNGYFLKEATLLAFTGAVSLWLSLSLRREAAAEPNLSAPVQISEGVGVRVLRYLLLGIGIANLAILAEIAGDLLKIEGLSSISHHAQFAMFILALILIIVGLSGFTQLPRREVSSPRPEGEGLGVRVSSEVLILAAITLLALVLRVWQLGSAVHHFVDEIHFSTAVANFWLNPEVNARLLQPFGSITAFPWLYPYMQYAGVSLLGRNLDGLRIVSAIFGTLTIPAVYLLAKTLFDRRIALLAALLLATFPPHIHFSRIGLNNIADPLFGVLALAFLARGIKNNRRMDFAIGGVSLGLTQYFYEGGRFLYPVLVCLWLVGMFLFMRRAQSAEPQENSDAPPESEKTTTRYSPFLRVRRPAGVPVGGKGVEGIGVNYFLTYLLAAVIIAAPIYYTLVALHKPLAARMDTVGIGGSYWMRAVSLGGGQTFDQHIVTPLLTYVYIPEQAAYYGGDQPMILLFLVPAFLLGVAWMLWRWRGAGMVLLLWVLLTSTGNSLMTYSALYPRYVVVFPALALLMAVGLNDTLSLFWTHVRSRAILVGIIVLIFASGQVAYYFGPHLTFYNNQIRPLPDEEDAMFRSASFPPFTRIYLITTTSPDQSYMYGVLGFVADTLTLNILTPDQVTPEYLATLSHRLDNAFYVEPSDQTTLALLRQYFELEPPQYSPYNLLVSQQFILYYAPKTSD